MSKKLAAKASLIQAPPPSAAAEAQAVPRPAATEARPKTAPGSMAAFMAAQSSVFKEADDLKLRLSGFEGASPVRKLDPQSIRPSQWANRHEHSFADAAFAELKADIEAAGTNVQPICVRPIKQPVLNGSTAEGEVGYEVVFGHRRHRACLELGLPVQAMVQEVDDLALFEAMERENRARKNLSAWEQGTMYRRALDAGLYPSQRRLSEALGVDVSLVSKSLALARLPDAVVATFPSPLDIQFRWAQPLAEALQKDPEGVIERAARIRSAGQSLTAAQVFGALLAAPTPGALNGSTPTKRVIEGRAGRRAVLGRDRNGKLTVEFAGSALPEAAEKELTVFIEKLLSKA